MQLIYTNVPEIVFHPRWILNYANDKRLALKVDLMAMCVLILA